jgi:serine/threonine protein kinase
MSNADMRQEVWDPNLDRRVAIKTIPLPPGDEGELVRSRLRQEAQITASLCHPNIVSVYDMGHQDQNAYIVMEYVDGRTLQGMMADTPKAEWWERFLPVEHWPGRRKSENLLPNSSQSLT